jgi:DeoR/GlpR family transcriptional regulator of sugar metabolism
MKEIQERELLEYLQKNKSAKIDEIAAALYVSPSTVRRRLKALQSKGLVTRTHGGALLEDEKQYLPAFTLRAHKNRLEKKKMAMLAVKFIKNGDVIFLDGSTSAYYVAEFLTQFENLKVITNGIDTLSLLSEYNITAYSTGGRVSRENRAVLVGVHAEQTLANLHADVAFFSAASVSKKGEIYDCYEEEIPLRQAMLANATKRVFLCDSTKFGKTSPYKLCSVNAVEYIISDQPMTDYFDAPITPRILHP